jgi:hypothetical protein
MKPAVRLIVASLVAGACVAPASSSPTPASRPSATASSSATSTAAPTVARGAVLVPPIASSAQYGDISITLDIPDRTGQPAEDIVWHVEQFKAPTGYAARIASVLGLTGQGVVGEMPAGGAPGANGPWRLWFGSQVLAVNETSGEVYYFDPSATDGAPPPGPARRDPADVLRLLFGQFGWSTDLTPTTGGVTAFRGTEVTVRADPVITGGSWLRPGYRETAILFPRYPNPLPQLQHGGPWVYGSDHVALLTSKGRPAQIVHRPAGQITGAEIYRITTFAQARSEILAAPARYLHFLSDPTGEPLRLTFGDAYLGSAFAGFTGGGLTHNGQVLVPVWVFTASGASASGVRVDALFIVDAVLPELRAQGLGGTASLSADQLLRFQLETLAGQNTALLTARGAAGYFLGNTCELTTATQEQSATGTMTCGATTRTFTMRRAFPGLGSSSVWYLAEPPK